MKNEVPNIADPNPETCGGCGDPITKDDLEASEWLEEQTGGHPGLGWFVADLRAERERNEIDPDSDLCCGCLDQILAAMRDDYRAQAAAEGGD